MNIVAMNGGLSACLSSLHKKSEDAIHAKARVQGISICRTNDRYVIFHHGKYHDAQSYPNGAP
jgi:hypothetical protein